MFPRISKTPSRMLALRVQMPSSLTEVAGRRGTRNGEHEWTVLLGTEYETADKQTVRM